MCFHNVPTCRMYLDIETACCGCSAQAASLHSQYHRCVSPGPSTLTESPGSERFPADRQTQRAPCCQGQQRGKPEGRSASEKRGQLHHATDDLCAKSLLTFSWNRAPPLITTPPTVRSLNVGDLEKSKCADRENRVCVHRGW